MIGHYCFEQPDEWTIVIDGCREHVEILGTEQDADLIWLQSILSSLRVKGETGRCDAGKGGVD